MRNGLIVMFAGASLIMTTCTKDIGGPGVCFQQELLPVFISNCTMSGCHNALDRKAGYDLTNYEGIMKGVKPKHPLLSEIYKSIKGSSPSMPARPYSKLRLADVDKIKLWII